jgi:hypothetical protein
MSHSVEFKNLTHIPFTYKIFPDDFPPDSKFPKDYKPRNFQPKTDFRVYYKGWGSEIEYLLWFNCDWKMKDWYTRSSPSRVKVLEAMNDRLEQVRKDNSLKKDDKKSPKMSMWRRIFSRRIASAPVTFTTPLFETSEG